MELHQATSLLTSLGFEKYDVNNENHGWDGHHQITLDDDELLFVEHEFVRQRLFVKLSPSACYEGEHDFSVYVMEDIGCCAVELPFQWAELSADWLRHLKLAFQLHGFKNDTHV